MRAKNKGAAPLLRWTASFSAAERISFVRSLNRREAAAVTAHWPNWAHDGQCPPVGEWRTWVMIAGRGFGKTRAGAEWIAGQVRAAVRRGEGLRIALVGATIDDARRVMIEGRSGLLTVAADLIVAWHPSRRLLRFAGGSEAVLFSGASPDALRGPEHHLAWCDELAKWDKPGECWDMLQLGLRLGEAPRTLVTTTPRPGAELERIMTAEGSVTSGGATYANPHLPGAFVGAVEEMYKGTRLGAQEIEGRLLSDVPGALWTMETIAACRVEVAGGIAQTSVRAEPFDAACGVALDKLRRGTREPTSLDCARDERGGGGCHLPTGLAVGLDLFAPLPVPDEPDPPPFLMQTWPAPPRGLAHRRGVRVAIGVDPPSGDGTCGIVVCALDRDGVAHVLADHSVSAASPERWARAVAEAAALYQQPGEDSPLIVAEVNQGGRMVESVLRVAGPGLRIKLVRAKEGKAARADPVALLFEAGRVRVHGRMEKLEAELCGLIAGGGYDGPGDSPDRADAMVWALGELMLRVRGEPRVRGF